MSRPIFRFCLVVTIGAAIYFAWWWIVVANQISVLVIFGTLFGNTIVGLIALIIAGLIPLAVYTANFFLIGYCLTRQSKFQSRLARVVLGAAAGGLAGGLGTLLTFPIPTLFKDYDYGYFGADYVLAAELQNAAWVITSAFVLGAVGSLVALYRKSRQAKLALAELSEDI